MHCQGNSNLGHKLVEKRGEKVLIEEGHVSDFTLLKRNYCYASANYLLCFFNDFRFKNNILYKFWISNRLNPSEPV